MRVAPSVVIDSSQKTILEQWARSRSLPARQVERAKIMLLAAEGNTDLEIAEQLGIGNHKVARWRKRFLKLGLSGLEKDASRRGRKPAIPVSVKLEVIHKTTSVHRPMPRTGARARWRARWGSAKPPCAESGMPTA
jgi:transposase